MTDKELIQALRCCSRTNIEPDCKNCPRFAVDCSCFACMMGLVRLTADRLEALLAENERLKAKMPKWRPASEPPKENINVFARDMAGVVTTAYYNGRWHGMLNCDAVTHWMPLPSTEEVPDEDP